MINSTIKLLVTILISILPFIGEKKLFANPGDSFFIEKWKEIESMMGYENSKIKNLINKIDNPTEQNYLNRADRLLLEKGRETEVIRLTTKALEEKESFLGYFMRCYAFVEINRNSEAIEDCTKALKFDNQSSSTFNNRGVAYQHLGKNYKAINDFNKAIDLDKQLAVAYWNIFISKYELGMRKGACNDLKKSVYLGSQTAKDWIESSKGKWCQNLR